MTAGVYDDGRSGIDYADDDGEEEVEMVCGAVRCGGESMGAGTSVVIDELVPTKSGKKAVHWWSDLVRCLASVPD